jgi:nucleoside-diphosphate-sugar epimerase
MYDEAKRFGEALVMAFMRTNKADARVVRIFNTYGPRCCPDDGRLVGNLIIQALKGDSMTIYGDGRQTRSLCYVSDLIQGLIAAMEAPIARGEVINLGNPDEHSVLEHATLIRVLVGSKSEFVFTRPAVGDDPQVRCPDIRKAQTLLGWSPRVALEDGLGLTIRYFRDVLGRDGQTHTNGVVTAPESAPRAAAL